MLRVIRPLSWLLGMLAYLLPPIWAAFALEADRRAQDASNVHCGGPAFGIVLFACLSSGCVSLVAIGLGIIYIRWSHEKLTLGREAELAALGIPLLLIVFGFLAMVLASLR